MLVCVCVCASVCVCEGVYSRELEVLGLGVLGEFKRIWLAGEGEY